MKVQIVAHAQGTEAWRKHRAGSLNASELASVMGLSAYTSRSELIKQKATGITPEVDAQTQRRFDAGHEFEAIARPWAEEIIGGDLYPVVLAGEVDGLNLSASLDGLDMASEISWEHKTGRADLLASLDQGVIPDEYHPQMEMGLMLSGADKCLFMASSGDKDAMRWAWYLPNLDLRAKIIAAWHQFSIDLATFVPEVTEAKPVGRTPETLPALRIEVTGMVTASNLAEYKAHALAVFGSINRELITDADFADAEKTVKWAADVESRLEAAKQHALSQTASIDDLFKTIDDISAEARRVRLELDKLVKARKDTIRAEIVLDGRNALADHTAALNLRIGKPLMPTIAYDFAGAIKGKRTIDSMRDAVATELARAKIAANEIADRITLNLRAIKEQSEHQFLFSDLATLALKDPEMVDLAIKSRIAEHQTIEAARLETERQRIAAQERAKAEAAVRECVDAEIAAATAKAKAEAQAQAQADAQARRASEDAIAKAALPLAPLIAPVYFDGPASRAVCEIVQTDNSDAATLRLSQINDRLSPVQINADGLRQLGFEPVATNKAANLYREADFPRICVAIVRHIQSRMREVATA